MFSLQYVNSLKLPLRFLKTEQFFFLFQTQLQDFKTQILTLLENPPDVITFVNKMTFAECTYLLSVYWLETLRIENSIKPSLQPMLEYLMDGTILKDKCGMWPCLLR